MYFALFFIGVLIGANIWLYWVAPILGIIFTGILCLGVLMGRYRWVSAIVIGLIIGFS